MEPAAPPPTFWAENLAPYVDTSHFAQLAARTKAAGTLMVPTQSLLEAVFSPETAAELLERPEMAYVGPRLREQWMRTKTRTDAQYAPEHRAQFLALRRQLIQMLYDGGVGFLLGSDAPQSWSVPGFSIHRELAALVASGLTPYQALATGTRDVAVFAGTLDSTGTIEVGKRADLLLLDANPLDDIANTSRITGVMLGGGGYPEPSLSGCSTSEYSNYGKNRCDTICTLGGSLQHRGPRRMRSGRAWLTPGTTPGPACYSSSAPIFFKPGDISVCGRKYRHADEARGRGCRRSDQNRHGIILEKRCSASVRVSAPGA